MNDDSVIRGATDNNIYSGYLGDMLKIDSTYSRFQANFRTEASKQRSYSSHI